MTATINLPKIMQIGAGAINALPATLEQLGCHYPCIITDSTMVRLGYTESITDLLNAHGLGYGLFSETMAEPSEDSILPAVALVQREKYDCLLALGGGSAIDTAKAIALLATHGGSMRDYKMPRPVNLSSMPVIAIPTTAGTGSEATQATIITDASTDEKMLCMGPGLMPMAAIVDYELTLSLPSRIAADTGIDALTHAIEAYVSRKANLFSDQQAIAAMKLIGQNLLKTCQDAKDLAAREAVMLGATLAGIAFSNASVALVHGMSRPLGVHFHVPHGLSNAMLLPTVTEYSISSAPTRYAQCAMYMGLIDNIEDENQAHQALLNQLKRINQTLSVPSLAEFGVDKDVFFSTLPLMAEQALASGSPNNNPRQVDKDEIVKLYEIAWES
ncbi:iron-containing alcohol dehydrogenase [Paraglaciecola sp. Hal342]|jgi:alcohol dehydrogenase class IV|uniref:Alcohol dehydrogenase n=1 Tax=Paraglaciecola chathamensis TaxID=368405 RepID=A0A8H9I6H1_9ALTE|nr:iron-containing alcohol dehydrogenase [Paraglaciecola oceanifecundans]AEE24682.1 iron-containing alcohol dehydrogenase [Glaciecola sp. 4H-3-7+YE-5]GGZ49715.1 alcohol dehydrogenase [Paraglaciecola oceanifecundans]